MGVPFVEIDHSGDIGIEVWGGGMAELIENATLGLLGLFCRGGVEPETTRQLTVESSSRDDLLVDWLAEVIATAGAHGELYGAVEITTVETVAAEPTGAGRWIAKGVLRGEKVDPARHDLRFEVKAATYHGLLVEEDAGGFHGRVILDL